MALVYGGYGAHVGVLLSRGCWGNYLPGCTCHCTRVSALMSTRCTWDCSTLFCILLLWPRTPSAYAFGLIGSFMLLRSILVLSSWPTRAHIHTERPCLFPMSWERGCGRLRGGARLGVEAEEPSLTWGMGPNSTKPCSLLLQVENGWRARGGGEGKKIYIEERGGGREGATISGIC